MYPPLAGFLLWMKPRGLDKLFSLLVPRAIRDYMNFVEENLSIRVKEEETHTKKGTQSERKDMLYYLFYAKNFATGGLGYSLAELHKDADMLTVAGLDTTSGVFAAMFFLLYL
jgi:hypothetical protein